MLIFILRQNEFNKQSIAPIAVIVLLPWQKSKHDLKVPTYCARIKTYVSLSTHFA